MFDYPTFGKITKIFKSNDYYDTIVTDDYCNMIVINFEHRIVTLYARDEGNGCDSHSIFEIPNIDLSSLVGKTILCIKESAVFNDLTCMYDCKEVISLSLIFNDNATFDFKLVHHSNGYYRGWLEIKEGDPI